MQQFILNYQYAWAKHLWVLWRFSHKQKVLLCNVRTTTTSNIQAAYAVPSRKTHKTYMKLCVVKRKIINHEIMLCTANSANFTNPGVTHLKSQVLASVSRMTKHKKVLNGFTETNPTIDLPKAIKWSFPLTLNNEEISKSKTHLITVSSFRKQQIKNTWPEPRPSLTLLRNSNGNVSDATKPEKPVWFQRTRYINKKHEARIFLPSAEVWQKPQVLAIWFTATQVGFLLTAVACVHKMSGINDLWCCQRTDR